MDTSQQALTHWLTARKVHWDALEAQLKPQQSPSEQPLAEARELLVGYRGVMNDLSLARRLQGTALITRYLENLFLKTHEELYRPAPHFWGRLGDLYHIDVPLLMRRMQRALYASLAVFVVALLVGWVLVSAYPELINLFASPAMIREVHAGRLWTDGLLNVAPSSLLSVGIAANNISVTLLSFGLGVFYGVGTLYMIGINGLMLGGAFAFAASYGLDGRLFAFIIGHGVVELSVIIIAGGLGLQLGEALIRPGTRSRLQAFQATCTDTGKVLLAATPFLLVAGIIEGFVSPNPLFGMMPRVLMGLGSGTLFWLVMLYGLPWRRGKFVRG
ncbi:stage II sporulation protein M [Methylovulum psychrotolerans]|uniref:Stage II sporulation protein M n=1 Tax=Methylovulum psychrotolerans TaxID=1704499 RepID=A0A2S5CR24_9GAMM|nr:stage II sporulation protein M [Methylovulum psychrotolerans]POZ53269.1 stage II sporulation protein M [Methylovulum psychrotolerans]